MTSTLSANDQDRLALLARQRSAIIVAIANLEQAKADNHAEVLDLIGEARGVIVANGEQVFTVTHRRTVNEDRAMEQLNKLDNPAPVLAMVTVTKVSPTALKKHCPDIYEQSLVESPNPVITPKVAA